MAYNEEDFLNLAGIQHFAFCRRQWALIHIEQQWKENVRTIEGSIFHENAHNGNIKSTRRGSIVSRGIAVFSRELGVNGICDVVEFVPDRNGVSIEGANGKYIPIPIEYKKGKPKENNADALQLCAQAMCLESMLLCDINTAFLYYGETRHRLKVEINDELREEVIHLTEEMHVYYKKGYTPKVKISKKCRACSLSEICIPKLCKNSSVKEYINRRIEEI